MTLASSIHCRSPRPDLLPQFKLVQCFSERGSLTKWWIFGVVKSNAFPGLSDKNWLSDFAFAAEIFFHMDEASEYATNFDINVRLQRIDKFEHDIYTNVRASNPNWLYSPGADVKPTLCICSFSCTSHTEGGHSNCKQILLSSWMTCTAISSVDFMILKNWCVTSASDLFSVTTL